MNVQLIDHLAYALIAMSFAVRDIFWLRSISILASVILVTVSSLTAEQWWAPIVLWNLLFIAINATRLGTMVYGERVSRFTDDERVLYETLFRNFTRLDFMKLIRIAQWQDLTPGQMLTRQGHRLDKVHLIVRVPRKLASTIEAAPSCAMDNSSAR